MRSATVRPRGQTASAILSKREQTAPPNMRLHLRARFEMDGLLKNMCWKLPGPASRAGLISPRDKM